MGGILAEGILIAGGCGFLCFQWKSVFFKVCLAV